MRLIAGLAIACAVAPLAVGSPLPMRPVPGEAFFGEVVALAPRMATTATVGSRGRATRVAVTARIARARLTGGPGSRNITVVMRRADGHPVARRDTSGAYLLPRSGQVAVAGNRRWGRMQAAVQRIAGRYPGPTAIWVHDVRTGRVAAWNADAEFPGASLVKLPLAVGAVMRMGSRPWTHPSWADVGEVLRRSSDHAANRLVNAVGSGCGGGPDAAAADGLRRLGARHSTYPGCYLVEHELQPRLPAGGVTDVPEWSTRHTTARDMGRMLFSLQAAAVPTAAGRRNTGIDPLRARLVLGLLLTADHTGGNDSLFAPGLPAGTPVAEKRGWRSGEQHGAAIAYTPRGPVIMVVLTQATGDVNPAIARAMGMDVARAVMAG